MINMMLYIQPLLTHGYSPLPLDHETGLPYTKHWQEHRKQPMHEQTLKWNFDLNPRRGLAVLGQFNGLVPIDIDTDDAEIMRAIGTVLPRPVVARKGTKGMMAFYRDPTGEVARAPRKNFCTPDHKPLVEVKALGVASIPPTLHRKTGRPYTWLRSNGHVRTLFGTFVEELGIITPEHLVALGRALEPWCPVPKVAAIAASSDAQPVSDKRMVACARKVLATKVADLSGLGCDRNVRLLMAARCLGKFVHHGVITCERVRDALIEACKANGYAAKAGLKQCHWTIDSGLKRAADDDLPVLQDRPKVA